MSDNLLAGPVDIVVIEFKDPKPNGRVAPAIAELIETGTIRILDLVFVVKDAEGDIVTLELSDLDPDVASSFDELEGETGGPPERRRCPAGRRRHSLRGQRR